MNLSTGDRERHRALVMDGADRDLADGGGLVGLAILDEIAFDRWDRALSDLHAREPDLSDAARRDRGNDLSAGREADALHAPAGGGLSDGPADPLRARLAGLLREGWGADTAYRGAADRFDRALEGLGHNLDRTDTANESLGRCREQVADHTEELEREIARTRNRDRGWD